MGMDDSKVKGSNRKKIKRSKKMDKGMQTECSKNPPERLGDGTRQKFKKAFNLEGLTEILHTPCCSSSIGIARFLFGLMMVVDIPDERGLFAIDLKYGNPMKCHFPLFDWMTPLPLEYMGILYFFMWLGAAGICLGYKFQLSCILFTVPYWYIFLLDKTTWNNHSYLFGLISILFTFSSAHHSFSVDSRLKPSIRNAPVPLWNYAIIRFQFFLLYFYAGVKKFDQDWIGGYSMTKLGMHWVFDPFRILLTDDQIDLWIIHIFGFLFDLTVGFFLLYGRTRPVAILFSSAFHIMNSRMFHIGQFPYVCLCMTPIFCSFDWPDRLWQSIKSLFGCATREEATETRGRDCGSRKRTNGSCKTQKLTTCLLLSYVALQLFLPYSHFITKGYNNWTNGLYGYSWDMMVHNWDSVLTVVRVVDNDSGEEFFLDPEAWVESSKFSKHGDMLIQYAHCLERNLPNISGSKSKPRFGNISVFMDVWCSLNGRFQQRMFDPRQDLVKAEWSPFKKISWLLPVISELTPWRKKISDMEDELFERSNGSGVLFVADFPGLRLDNYINSELANVTITVLQGTVIVERTVDHSAGLLGNTTFHQGEGGAVASGEFHTVYTVSPEPSCYMYSYVNVTHQHATDGAGTLKGSDSLMNSIKYRFDNFIDSILILRSCFNKFLYDVPIPIRMK